MRNSSILVAAAAFTVVVVAVVLGSALITPGTGRAFGSYTAAPASLLQEAPVIPGSGGQTTGILVSGEGTVTVKPDVARVTLGVEVSNPSAATAQQDAASRMDSVMSELKGLGIQEKDIQTVRFDLSPEYDYSGRTPVLKGYRVTNLVAVTVRDITQLGGLLDRVVASGATRLYGISFSVSDPTAAGTRGREEAMNNAKAKAEQLAKLAGVTLGRPISIEETVSAPPVPADTEVRAAPAAAPMVQTPISPGTQEIHTVVRVVYSIQ